MPTSARFATSMKGVVFPKMIKLFDEDSYIKSFSASVVSCEKYQDGYLVLLDKTAFFPTAGGQECDGGTLDGMEVLSVILRDDEVYHFVKNPIEVGKSVTGEIYWADRLRKMQHHSAEHIVSGLAFSQFGLTNIGFHLGADDVTIDYDTEISESGLTELERLANEVVRKNLEISASYPTEAELENISYRSKKEILGRIRIVTIPGVDVCACCAPHVRQTGEIGLIKFTDMMRHRGGVRIRMICAEDALCDYSEKQKNAYEISKMLSVPQNEVADGVSRVLDELSEQKRKNSELQRDFAAYEAQKVPETDGNYLAFTALSDKNAQRLLATEAKKRVNGVFMLVSGDDETGYSYIILGETASEAAKKLNAALSGKGGGKNGMAEGRFFASKDRIEAEFKAL